VPAAIDIEITGEFLGDSGTRGGFIVLAGLLGSFLFIRTSARMIRAQVPWWPGNVETSGGLHIHHLVIGIVTIMAAGFMTFAFDPGSPWREILAGVFGVGCGLTLDEFALWLHLEDVYWAREGRSSVDAVVVATIIGGMIVLGAAPLDTANGGSISAIALAVSVNLAFVLIAVAKGKLWLALVGTFVPTVSFVAAIRLARPASRWARRRYVPGSAKAERSERRDVRVRALQSRVADLVAGAPSADSAKREHQDLR
jgi:lysyl-tRNA synthetase class 2